MCFIFVEYEVERLKKAVDALMVSNAEKVRQEHFHTGYLETVNMSTKFTNNTDEINN